MSLYPLRLTFGEARRALTVVVSPDGWKFATPSDRDCFEARPTSERLALRRQLAAQVELAKNTPTKGDT
jgi:hypothetical protein